jgi:cytochrome c-type biogenesis protein CcmH/NrfF
MRYARALPGVPGRLGWSLLLLAVLAGSASAQDDAVAPQRTPDQISQMSLHLQAKFMSPYCPAANLRDCTSGQAEVLRQEIRGWVAEGRSEEWITQQMVGRFGDAILAAPKFKGFGMLAYITPVVVLLAGLGLVILFLRRQARLRLAPADAVVEPGRDYKVSPDAERRLQEELDARS